MNLFNTTSSLLNCFHFHCLSCSWQINYGMVWRSIQLGTSDGGGGDVSSHGWHIGHLQHVATSVGARRQRQSPPLVVVRRYKLHSRCSGQHVLIAGRQPTARAPLSSDYGTDSLILPPRSSAPPSPYDYTSVVNSINQYLYSQ